MSQQHPGHQNASPRQPQLRTQEHRGIGHGRNRPWMYDSGTEDAGAELNPAVRPHLYVQSMDQGGSWAGEAGSTQVIPAAGDPIATDLMALGLIKAFGRWALVTTKKVWTQVRIRHAIALGLGAHGPHEVERLTEEMSRGHGDFANLIADIQPHADLIEVRQDTLRSPLP